MPQKKVLTIKSSLQFTILPMPSGLLNKTFTDCLNICAYPLNLLLYLNDSFRAEK